MHPTQMSISVAEQIEIFKIIIQYPEIINWLSIGRHEPSADAICDAAHFMEKGFIRCKQMEKALLDVFQNLTGAKKIRYYRQLKLLAIMFDTYKNKGKSVKQSLLAILQQLVQAYINKQQNFKPLSYSDLKK